MFTNKYSKTRKIEINKINNDIDKISKSVLIVIYTKNSEELIKKTINEIVKQNVDFIFLDELSNDSTLSIIKNNNWNYIEGTIDDKKNLLLAIEYARNHNYKYMIQYKLNEQYDISDIFQMIFYAQKGYDIILTNRFYKQDNLSNNKIKRFSIINFFFRLKTKQDMHDSLSSFMLINWVVMNLIYKNKKLDLEPSSIAYMTNKSQLKIKEIPTIIYHKDAIRYSKYQKKRKNIRYNISQFFKLINIIHWGKYYE